MIKFHAIRRDGAHILGLGLSRINCERLLAGQFITVKLDEMRALGSQLPWEGEVIIMAGETEASITDEMVKYGALDLARVSGDMDALRKQSEES